MKVSIITPAYNSASTISTTIESVLRQDYLEIEYIIIEGKSTDDTLRLAKEYLNAFKGRMKIVSEVDDGLYDAMNKGIRLATGDIVGILNSDDFFTSTDIITKVVKAFDDETDGVYGDINFIKQHGKNEIIRTISTKNFTPRLLRYGIMPPHPSFYIRKRCYDKYGLYKTNYKISADFDLMARMMLAGLKLKRLDFCLVTMRNGGTSTRNIHSRITSIKELRRACRENNIKTCLPLLLMRFPYKIREFNFKALLR